MKEGVFKRQHNPFVTAGKQALCRQVCRGVQRACGGETGKIPVENPYFSTFSTAFSTGVLHSRYAANVCILVYITDFDRLRLFRLFFFRQHFAKPIKQVKKIVLDRKFCVLFCFGYPQGESAVCCIWGADRKNRKTHCNLWKNFFKRY